MAENKKERFEIKDEELDVSGGRVNLGQVMGEVANAREEGEDATFLGQLLKNLFGFKK